MKVPRRPLGELYDNPRLSSTVSIIGLGCSSFSTFFWTDEEHEAMSSLRPDIADDDDDTKTTTTTTTGGGWTVETLNRRHPKVQEWIDTIRYAVLECGITLLDTAPWYGHGTSEVVMGWAFQELLFNDNDDEQQQQQQEGTNKNHPKDRRVHRNDLIINTKVGRYQADPQHQFDYTYETTVQSVDRSLQRMNLSYVDVLQLHDPEFILASDDGMRMLLEQTIPAMIHCQQQGKCKALGMTGYPLFVQHAIFQRTLDFSNNHTIWDQALTYGHFNLHDTSLFTQPISLLYTTTVTPSTTTTSTEQLDTDQTQLDTMTTSPCDSSSSFARYCQDHSIVTLAAAPLSLGLLTPQGPPIWHPAGDELKHACANAAEIVATAAAREQQPQQPDEVKNDFNQTTTTTPNMNIATLALVFALAHPGIPCTILGMKNVHEVQVAAAAANRFHHVVTYNNNNNNNVDCITSPDDRTWLSIPLLSDILSQVFTKEEWEVFQQIQDPQHGPFANVWKNGIYQWDGMQQAKDFWKQLDSSGQEQQ